MSWRFELDGKWLLIGVVILAAVLTTVMLNTNHNDNIVAQLTGGLNVDNGDLKINWDRYTPVEVALSGTYTITQSGVYHLTGAIDDGLVMVEVGAEGEVKLILDNVSIHNSTGPAITCFSGDDLVIELVGENILEDGASYVDYDEEVAGAIYSKADLTLQGEGELDLTANYQDGIVGKDDVKFNSGKYRITAVDDGVRGKDSVYIVKGDLTIKAGADGVKSTNETDVGKGFVMIEDGNFIIDSGDDGIHANRSLVIDGGEIIIAKAYEGLEAQVVTINGGKISLTTLDDGINAGSGADSSANNRTGAGMFDADENCVITINNGEVYVNSFGDGIDSNGWLYFNGGYVVVDGPTNDGNGALDAGMGIVMNGGKVLAVGSSGMAETLGADSSIFNVSIYLTKAQVAGTKVEIIGADGEVAAEHTAKKTFSHIAVGTPEFKFGETYTIYLNGEKYEEFTISGITTTVGKFSTPKPQNTKK